MGLYERIVEEAAGEDVGCGDHEEIRRYSRPWSPPAPGARGYVTVEDLERGEKRREQEREKVLREEKRRASEIRALRAFVRQVVHSRWQGMAFRSLQRKYPVEWDRISWGHRT